MDKLLIDILKDQVKPALGCTEPAAVAYAVSRAKDLLGEDAEKLIITVDPKLLKNGLSVYIPGTDEKGLIFAAALALVIGEARYGLECLKNVDEDSSLKAKEIQDNDIIQIEVKDDEKEIYIEVRALSKDKEARVIIKDSHANIVFESLNNEILLDKDSHDKDKGEDQLNKKILDYSINDLIDFIDKSPTEDLLSIKDGKDMNLAFAQDAKDNLKNGLGSMLYENSHDSYTRAEAMTALASEARMTGSSQSVMTCAGSGNNGLIAIIPISIVGKEKGKSEEEIIRAVALSHLISIYIKARLGPLSPVCGGGIAGGSGYACALTYLLGGNRDQILLSLNNMLAGLTGMICDGAKVGCAYKLSISVASAKDAAMMALNNIEIPSDNGILGSSPEESIENFARLSNTGMNNTDNTILDIMVNKC